MNILEIAPLYRPINSEMKYGGIERVIYNLACKFSEHNCNVFMIARTGSKIPGLQDLIFCDDLDYEHQSEILYEYISNNTVDIIHMHRRSILETKLINMIEKKGIPIVITLHGPKEDVMRHYKDIYLPSTLRFTSVSEYQYQSLKSFFGDKLVGYIRNAVNSDMFVNLEVSREHLLFLGRISEYKGCHIVIRIAKETNTPLVIAGVIHKEDEDYCNQWVLPHVDGQMIKFVGSVNDPEKVELLNKSLAVVCPITWDDPCPVVALESMSCGTPVIAYNRGSMSELIKHGTSGYIANNYTELCESVRNLSKIVNSEVRKHIQTSFTWNQASKHYLQIFNSVIK